METVNPKTGEVTVPKSLNNSRRTKNIRRITY
jgi:hypothetical protein